MRHLLSFILTRGHSLTCITPSFGRGITRTTFTLLEWSHKPEVVEAWEELSRKFKLTTDPFKDRGGVFGLADVSVTCGWPFTQSMGKARKFGWLGTVDTYESIFQSLKELGEIGVSVPPVVKDFRPWGREDGGYCDVVLQYTTHCCVNG